MSDARFGQPIPSTVSDSSMLHGWNKRPEDWEFEAGVQHQLLPRVGLDVGYFRRWYGNFTVIDNLATATSDYTQYSVTAPVDPRLPERRRVRVSGTSTTSTRTKWGRSTISSPWPATTGTTSSTGTAWTSPSTCGWDGERLLQGGTSTGRTSMDVCDIRANLPELAVTATGLTGGGSSPFSVSPTQPFCHLEGSFLTQVKFLGTYMVPKVDVQIAGTFRSLPGPNYHGELHRNERRGAALAWPSALGRRRQRDGESREARRSRTASRRTCSICASRKSSDSANTERP